MHLLHSIFGKSLSHVYLLLQRDRMLENGGLDERRIIRTRKRKLSIGGKTDGKKGTAGTGGVSGGVPG